MTYTNVQHLHIMNQPIYYARSKYTSAMQDPTVVWCLLSREPLRISAYFTLPETRVPKQHDSCHSMGLSAFYFTQLFSKAKTACSRWALKSNPTVIWRVFSREPAQTLYCQKLESLPKICTTDSMCLSLLAFMQLFSKVARSKARQPGAKTEFNTKYDSRLCIFGSLKSRLQTVYCYMIMLALSLNAENCRSRQLYCRLMPPPQGTLMNICINRISPESRVICLHSK